MFCDDQCAMHNSIIETPGFFPRVKSDALRCVAHSDCFAEANAPTQLEMQICTQIWYDGRVDCVCIYTPRLLNRASHILLTIAVIFIQLTLSWCFKTIADFVILYMLLALSCH